MDKPSVVFELFQSFNRWKCWNVYKNCVGKYKLQKSKIFLFSWGYCGHIFYKAAFIPPNNPIGHRILLLLNLFNVLTHEISWKFHKSCMKMWKINTFWDFCDFCSQFERFHYKTFFISKQKSFLDEFVPSRTSFIFSATSRSKIEQKLDENFENSFFWCFRQFRFKLEAFFRINCFYLYQEASETTNSFLATRFQLSKLASVSKIWQKLHKNIKNLNFLDFFKNRSEFGAVFHWNIALISSVKPLG